MAANPKSQTLLTGHQHRAQRSRMTILDAAVGLLVDRGPAGFNIDAIVERTGVAKTTIYRHWSSRDSLLAAAIGHHFNVAKTANIPDTGSLRGDLLAYINEGLRAMHNDSANRQLRTLPGIIDAAHRDPSLAELCVDILKLTLSTLRPMFERGVERGEVCADRDIDAMTHLVLGALFIHQALDFDTDEAYVTEVVDTVLSGVSRKS